MKSKYNTLTCLFGHHNYSKEITIDKGGGVIHLCKICKQSGHWKWNDGEEIWIEYDEEGNKVCEKWNDGFEVRCKHDKRGNCIYENWNDGEERWYDYNKEGNMIHFKYSNGEELWRDNSGKDWTHTKPENWKYEKYLQ